MPNGEKSFAYYLPNLSISGSVERSNVTSQKGGGLMSNVEMLQTNANNRNGDREAAFFGHCSH